MSDFQFMAHTISPRRFDCNRLSGINLYHNGDMETFATRVRTRRKQLGLSQKELAAKAKISQTTISDIERGRNDGSREMLPLARALQVNADWLESGLGDMDNALHSTLRGRSCLTSTLGDADMANTAPTSPLVGRVPVISWVRAGEFCGIVNLYEPGDAEDWLPRGPKHGKHTYALKITGDSMVAPYPGQRTYPPGCWVYVDPDVAVTNGCRVIAKLPDSQEATFKQYVEDGGKRYLKPLNPQYPTMEMTEGMLLCGVVVGKHEDE